MKRLLRDLAITLLESLTQERNGLQLELCEAYERLESLSADFRALKSQDQAPLLYANQVLINDLTARLKQYEDFYTHNGKNYGLRFDDAVNR